MTLSFNAKFIHFAARFQDKPEGSRPYLCGLHFTKSKSGGVLVVSTDGHRMGVFHDPDGEIGEDLLLKFDKAFLSVCKKGGVVKVTGQDSALFDEAGNKINVGLVRDMSAEWPFPDWRRLLPQGSPTEMSPQAFNPSYIKDFDFEKGSPILITQYEVSAPAVVISRAIPGFLGLLMPMRWEDPCDPLPEFLK